jgi:hypothetical protein
VDAEFKTYLPVTHTIGTQSENISVELGFIGVAEITLG